MYNTQDEMLDTNTTCERISEVYTSYDVLMHWPEARRKAGHVALKEAAYSKGGNAVVLTSQIAVFGKIEDEVKGIAFKCTK